MIEALTIAHHTVVTAMIIILPISIWYAGFIAGKTSGIRKGVNLVLTVTNNPEKDKLVDNETKRICIDELFAHCDRKTLLESGSTINFAELEHHLREHKY